MDVRRVPGPSETTNEVTSTREKCLKALSAKDESKCFDYQLTSGQYGTKDSGYPSGVDIAGHAQSKETKDAGFQSPMELGQTSLQQTVLGQASGEGQKMTSTKRSIDHDKLHEESQSQAGVQSPASVVSGQSPSVKNQEGKKPAKTRSVLASSSTSALATLQKQQANTTVVIDKVLSRGRRPFDVVLKGGAPWGFALNGGKGIPLYISKIVAGGKAGDSALVEGDYVLRVNDIPCSDVGQALDIVDTAFSTLTITVLRLWNKDSELARC